MEHVGLYSIGTNHKKFNEKRIKIKIKIYFAECLGYYRGTHNKVVFKSK